MNATIGDRILVRGHQLGDPERKAQILEIHGKNGAPPYVVRWGDDGHIATYFPGSDARIVHADGHPADGGESAESPLRRQVRDGLAAIRRAELRAQKAGSVAEIRMALDAATQVVRATLDEMRVHIHLADEAADDAWEQAVAAVARLDDAAIDSVDTARDIATDVVGKLRNAVGLIGHSVS